MINVGNNIRTPIVSKNGLSSDQYSNYTNYGNKQFENILEEIASDKENELESSDSNNGLARISGNVYGGQTTDKGTHIVQPGEDMDKDAFLKILATQMANQDPTQPQDGTEYVSQFAQFAAMEQMTNLNKTMSRYAAESLLSRGVMLNAYDSNGRAITGIVRSVAQNGSTTLVGVEYLNDKNEYVIGDFKKDDISTVIDVPDNRLDYINNNMAMIVGSSMLNKDIEFIVSKNDSEDDIVVDEDKDTKEPSESDEVKDDSQDDSSPEYETKFGRVESVVVENFMIKLRVSVDGKDEIETVTLDKVIRVDG